MGMERNNNKYRNRFYNHFESEIFIRPPEYTLGKNFLMRYNAKFDYYKTPENILTIVYANQGAGVFHRHNNKLLCRGDSFTVLNRSDGWEYINEDNRYVDILSFGISKEFDAQFKYYLKSQLIGLLDSPYKEDSNNYQFFEMPLKADYFLTGRLLKRIYESSMSDNFEFISAEEITIELLKTIYREQLIGEKKLRSIKAIKRTTQAEVLRRLFIAYEYIHDNISRPITSDELSSVACLSKFHFYETFKTVFGKTPHQYINYLKMQNARKVLKSNILTVGEVSSAFGFSDLGSFSRMFKKTFGKPPSFYID